MEHWICNVVPPSNNGTNKETIYIFLTGWWRLKNKLVCSSARRRKFSSYSNFPTVTFCGCGNGTLLYLNCGKPSLFIWFRLKVPLYFYSHAFSIFETINFSAAPKLFCNFMLSSEEQIWMIPEHYGHQCTCFWGLNCRFFTAAEHKTRTESFLEGHDVHCYPLFCVRTT